MTDRCPACADLTAPCLACFTREMARLCDALQPVIDACKALDDIAEALRPKPIVVTTNGTDVETLRLLHLGDVSTGAALEGALAELRADGRDTDEMLRRAGAVLSAWHDRPYRMETP